MEAAGGILTQTWLRRWCRGSSECWRKVQRIRHGDVGTPDAAGEQCLVLPTDLTALSCLAWAGKASGAPEQTRTEATLILQTGFLH